MSINNTKTPASTVSRTVTADRVREILLAARDKMNDRGKHWIKNHYFVKKPVVGNCYCSIGAINSVTKVKSERNAAYKALAQYGLDKFDFPHYFGDDTIGKIIHHNDIPTTRWGDVSKAFRRAAKRVM